MKPIELTTRHKVLPSDFVIPVKVYNDSREPHFDSLRKIIFLGNDYDVDKLAKQAYNATVDYFNNLPPENECACLNCIFKMTSALFTVLVQKYEEAMYNFRIKGRDFQEICFDVVFDNASDEDKKRIIEAMANKEQHAQ